MSKKTEKFLIKEIKIARETGKKLIDENMRKRSIIATKDKEIKTLEEANAELGKDLIFLSSLFERRAYLGEDGQMHRFFNSLVCDGKETFERLDEYVSGYAEEVKSWEEIEQDARD